MLNMTKTEMNNHYKMVNLIASYEEVFKLPVEDRITCYYGDYGIHALQYGKSITPELENKVFNAIGMSKDAFLANPDFKYRASIVAFLCEKNHIKVPDYIPQLLNEHGLKNSLDSQISGAQSRAASKSPVSPAKETSLNR